VDVNDQRGPCWRGRLPEVKYVASVWPVLHVRQVGLWFRRPAGRAQGADRRRHTGRGKRGQKQRTALARAIALNPRILVLDDALSAVDTYTEEEILDRLRRFMERRTSIIVSHRISTVRDAGLILVLDAGRIVERGTHASLVAAGGIYAEMHRRQLLEEELAAS